MSGITSAEDAAAAALAEADCVGMIVGLKSKRSVSVSLARKIAAAARANGAEPVGVFVDESAAEIERVCSAANLAIAQLGTANCLQLLIEVVGFQLHGVGARAFLLQGLPASLKVIYVLHANQNGILQTSFLRSEGGPLKGAVVETRHWNSEFRYERYEI